MEAGWKSMKKDLLGKKTLEKYQLNNIFKNQREEAKALINMEKLERQLSSIQFLKIGLSQTESTVKLNFERIVEEITRVKTWTLEVRRQKIEEIKNQPFWEKVANLGKIDYKEQVELMMERLKMIQKRQTDRKFILAKYKDSFVNFDAKALPLVSNFKILDIKRFVAQYDYYMKKFSPIPMEFCLGMNLNLGQIISRMIYEYLGEQLKILPKFKKKFEIKNQILKNAAKVDQYFLDRKFRRLTHKKIVFDPNDVRFPVPKVYFYDLSADFVRYQYIYWKLGFYFKLVINGEKFESLIIRKLRKRQFKKPSHIQFIGKLKRFDEIKKHKKFKVELANILEITEKEEEFFYINDNISNEAIYLYDRMKKQQQRPPIFFLDLMENTDESEIDSILNQSQQRSETSQSEESIITAIFGQQQQSGKYPTLSEASSDSSFKIMSKLQPADVFSISISRKNKSRKQKIIEKQEESEIDDLTESFSYFNFDSRKRLDKTRRHINNQQKSKFYQRFPQQINPKKRSREDFADQYNSQYQSHNNQPKLKDEQLYQYFEKQQNPQKNQQFSKCNFKKFKPNDVNNTDLENAIASQYVQFPLQQNKSFFDEQVYQQQSNYHLGDMLMKKHENLFPPQLRQSLGLDYQQRMNEQRQYYWQSPLRDHRANINQNFTKQSSYINLSQGRNSLLPQNIVQLPLQSSLEFYNRFGQPLQQQVQMQYNPFNSVPSDHYQSKSMLPRYENNGQISYQPQINITRQSIGSNKMTIFQPIQQINQAQIKQPRPTAHILYNQDEDSEKINFLGTDEELSDQNPNDQWYEIVRDKPTLTRTQDDFKKEVRKKQKEEVKKPQEQRLGLLNNKIPLKKLPRVQPFQKSTPLHL
ncbi:UNKNOWN [Stylonychia lemnae]|uniref:Uncharacterized protein n=1 Tax=Stylonychia lemnae TaxID=5949 RepID=A0A078AZ12_STYLE|nr:UNKNOWN [Stylonychia lemnae]|eukprot:CDW86432.1 UNKNOWN [Stylonychia lemnae]